MIKSTMQMLCAGLAVGLLAASASAQSNPPAAKGPDKLAALFGDELVVKAKGFEIKRSEMEAEVMAFKAAAAGRGQPIPPAEAERAEQQILQQMIRVRMVLAHANADDKAKGKENGEKRIKLAVERAGSEENLVRDLKPVGISLDKLKSRLAEEATVEAVVEREIKVNVTDADVKKFYEENPARFEQPQMVRASHILFGTLDSTTRQPLSDEAKASKRKLAEEVLKRAKGGEDFAKLVKEFSEDPGSKDKDGEYTFPRGQMVPEFESAAFALGENQISDVVTTQFGYHIIKVLEKLPAKKVEFEKVSERIKDVLTQDELKKQLPDYFENLKKEANPEVLDEKLKPSERDSAPPAAAAKPDAAK